jgi:hypothetical protein
MSLVGCFNVLASVVTTRADPSAMAEIPAEEHLNFSDGIRFMLRS